MFVLCCVWVGLGWVESTWNLGALLTAPQQSLFFLSFLGDHLPRTLSSTKRYSAFSFLLFLYRYFTEYLFFTSNIPFPLLPQFPFYPFNSWKNIYLYIQVQKTKLKSFFFSFFLIPPAHIVKKIRRKEFKYSRMLR